MTPALGGQAAQDLTHSSRQPFAAAAEAAAALRSLVDALPGCCLSLLLLSCVFQALSLVPRPVPAIEEVSCILSNSMSCLAGQLGQCGHNVDTHQVGLTGVSGLPPVHDLVGRRTSVHGGGMATAASAASAVCSGHAGCER